jgi:transcriptional regulator with XRE-family HTH domain
MEMQSDPLERTASEVDGPLGPRNRSSSRLAYLAETRVFKAQHGGLETVRLRLGFSRRKMCQLLLVDPSAWTRWARDESKVPPHIYRALEWFLALHEKSLTQPELASIFHARHRLKAELKVEDQAQLQAEIAHLREDLQRHKWILWYLIAGIAALAVSLSFVVLRQLHG